MYIKNLKLSNFRNYKNLDIEFSNGINIIYGNNGIGKTNILEAIYLSAITKSYRVSKETEYIKFNESVTHIASTYVEDNIVNMVEVSLTNNGEKQILENKLKIKKYTEFIGKYPIVMFSPDDMEIVKGAPKNRRRFLDILISQISKKYIIALSEYKKLINIKNSLLKKNRENIDINYLKIINEKLAVQILEIICKRKEYVEKLLKFSISAEKMISKHQEEIRIEYVTEFTNMDFNEILNTLNNCIENDIAKKTSTKGIGHDDILIFVDEKEVAKYGSQGQNRTALLALKIGEFELLINEKNIVPIILLDDVFSELDNERINFLLSYIKNYQVIITTTMIENIKLEKAKFFDIINLVKKFD